jgi:hypothetical protein
MIRKINNWWKNLEWDADRDLIKQGVWKRETPLKFKDLFLRDRKAVLNTVLLIFSVIIMIFMMISNTYSYDYNNNFNIKTYDLPTSGVSEEYLFQHVINATLFFKLNESDNRVLLDFPINYTFNNLSPDAFGFIINWTVLDKIYSGNDSFNVSVIISNSVNNNTQSLGLRFDIEKTEQPILEVKGSSELQIINDTFIKTVTVDMLPDTGNMTFNIEGDSNKSFTIDNCGKFLICPVGQYNFNAEGKRKIVINYGVSVDTVVGEYNTSFSIISNEDTNKTINVKFNIAVPSIFVNPPELPDYCYKSNIPFDLQLDCKKIIAEWEAEKIIGYQNYIARVNTDKICAEYKEIEYVIGDSISDAVLRRNVELMDENRNEREQNLFLESEILRLNQIKLDLKVEINRTKLQCDVELQDLRVDEQDRRLKIYKASEEDKILFMQQNGLMFKWIAGIFMFIPLLIISYAYLMRQMFMTTIRIPHKILSIISGFFGIIWIVLVIWI